MPAAPTTDASEANESNASNDASVALAAIVDQCLQYARMAGRDRAPRKTALSMTMHDGGVLRVTVELPRGR
jgi:hypothetical protein